MRACQRMTGDVLGVGTIVMAVVGLSVLSAGCLATADDSTVIDSLSREDEPHAGPLSGISGSGGVNGLNPLSFHLYKYTVFDSMAEALAEHLLFGWHIRDTAANQALLLNVLQGREVMQYAVRCGLAGGQSVYGGSPPATFTGQGLLTTTTAWRTASLSIAHKEDLFSCLIAHLNSLDIEVPIMLSGPSVYNSPGFDGSAYEFDEALWATAITYDAGNSPHFDFYVWPSPELDDLCLADLTGVLDLRLCGSFLGPCNITVRTDRTTACYETAGGFFCDGEPAIQTRLRMVDVPLLYGVCLP